MKAPRTSPPRKSSFILCGALLTFVLALLIVPTERLGLSAHAQNGQTPAATPSYASLTLEQVAQLKNFSKRAAQGQPFSAEEKYILSRFTKGAQISELEAQVLISRVLYEYYLLENYVTSDNYDLLKRYQDYCLTEHRFIEDARLKMKRETYLRQLAFQPKTSGDVHLAAIPSNDQCAGAISITDTGSYPITTTTVDAHDATTTGDPTFCAAILSGQDDTIWYTFVPALTATYTITTCPGIAPGTSTTDTILGVFTSTGACGGPFTSVDCSDDDVSCGTNNNATTISPILTAGVTYYIVAGRSQFSPEPGSVPIQIAITRLPAPANDTCATATPLTLDTPVSGGTTVAANNDYQLSGTSCFSGWGDNSVGNSTTTATGRDVVYSFTAPYSATFSFRVTKFGTTLDPALYLMTSCPGGAPPNSVTCSNTTGPATVGAHRVNGTGAQEIPCFVVNGGQTVYLVVDEAFVTAGSTSFTVEVNRCTEEPEANDNHANDTPATAGVGNEGVISSTTDVDFYVLGTPVATSRVFAMIDGLAGNSSDFDMRVTNTTDTLEFDSNDADSQFGSLSAALGGTLLTGVDSFLRVSHGGATSASGPYRLYTKVQPGGSLNTPNCSGTKNSATAEAEPNNTAAQANSAVNNYFYGDIPTPAPATDADYYSFTATAGDLIFMALDGDPCRGSAMNAQMDLRDSADALLIGVNDGDGTNCGGSCGTVAGNLAATTPVAPAEGLVWRARYSGTYYAKVYAGAVTTIGTGDYLLSISLNNDHGPTAADSSIAGKVVNTTGAPLPGITMLLTDSAGTKQTTTDADGNYSFPELETGDFFVVAPAPGIYSFTPTKRPYSLRSNIVNANFTANAVWGEGVKSNTSSGIQSGLTATMASGGQTIKESWAGASPVSSAAAKTKPSLLSTQQGIAAGAAVKIQIRQTGWYRLPQPDLLAAGLDLSANARMLQLYVEGDEVPMRVNGDGVHLNPGDSIEFYGVALDTPTSDSRTYWLVNGNSAGKRITPKRGKIIPGDKLWTDSTATRSFSSTSEYKDKFIYFPTVLNGDADNIFGPLVMTDPTTQSLTVTRLDSDTTIQPQLEIALQGATTVSHTVAIKLNDTYVGTVSFKDREHPVAKLSIDRQLLHEGDNVLSVASEGGSSDISFIDWIRLTYSHRYIADGNKLQFTVPGGQTVRVSGFTTPNIRLFDVTNSNAVTEVETDGSVQDGGYAFRVQAKGSDTRTMLAFADELAEGARSVTPNHPSTLSAQSNGADFLIITHSDFRDAVEPLAAQRRNEGLSVTVVDVEDVYDEFSYGVHSPYALKDFLAYTSSHWNRAPQFVLLVGDSSWDPRNYFSQGENDFVPTKLVDTFHLETASDDWFVDFADNTAPTMAIGRIPARTAADASLIVSKILSYDLERQSGAPLRGAVMVADDGFEKENSQTKALLPSNLSVQTINRGDLGTDDLNREQIVNALNLGPSLVNYFGHGSVDLWSGEGLNNSLASGLTNTSNRLSLYVLMTCLNGYAHDAYIDSLGESILKAPNGGGMAVWASSGLTEPTPQQSMSSEFYRQLFGTQPLRLGQAITRAKLGTTDADVRRTWILLGDPTMRLQ